MLYRLAADALVLVHLAFILLVLFGGLLVVKWRAALFIHLPALAWGLAVEGLHLACPLTGWENRMRAAAGGAGYQGGFVEHYIWPLIYPAGLTPQIQTLLGLFVLLQNLVVYSYVIRRWRRSSG
ncbi:Protein of Uncharacterised function (DUF2784) [Pseudomonas putida]|uniref:DUF2784 domain-containing protein n=1 Tax=Pseudomonas guariconensis TaxID=1288410 RepID=A0AAX0VRI6_9PSED|nr:MULTISPECIES: DUF2784 domain-containing protein [Pseudomonas]CAB5536313.1 Protein of Uncharacterised function (DUF2784) [Pseudomonas putida]MCO7624162.1 DUF2784 domain-containing protein [Pseudomonas guariconensis]MDM9593779.1 DUF2784 domain-containing protein [Pseudomonas guariconensis]MDM9606606.1 DUF2784 domain-containing protein [Pseudomonas guariconensis]MDM9611562.1 DUF2784 domain-containing protein [Pseudomonas guariconensis]